MNGRVTRLSFLCVLQILHLRETNGSPLVPSLPHGANMMAMPSIEGIDVKCGRSGMTVHVTFDRPFPGVIYSKGHYYDRECNYVTSGVPGAKEFSFLIPVDSCGTTGHLGDPTPEQDMYYENTVIIQNDPLIQEVWDTAKKLKCSWEHSFSKSVHSNPILVESPKLVKLDFDSRSVNTLMTIQKGRSPFSAPATGYIYVGDDTSIVIYLQDETETLDANAVSCTASSSRSEKVELVDKNGCLVRPNLMTPFSKLRNPEGVDATLMLYSYFKAFRVGDDPNIHINCQLEVCEGSCLEPCALGPYADTKRRSRRDTEVASNKSRTFNVDQVAVILAKVINAKENEEQRVCILPFFGMYFQLILLIWCFVAFTSIIIFHWKLNVERERLSNKSLDLDARTARLKMQEKRAKILAEEAPKNIKCLAGYNSS